MFFRLLSRLFPPKLPDRIKGWNNKRVVYEEQGGIGVVKHKHFKDGIARHFAEGHRRTTPQYMR